MICRVVSAAYPIEIFQKRGFLKNKTHKILWSAVIWRLCISKTKGSQIPFVFLKLDDFWGVVEWVSYFWGPYRHLKSVPNNHQRTTVYQWHPVEHATLAWPWSWSAWGPMSFHSGGSWTSEPWISTSKWPWWCSTWWAVERCVFWVCFRWIYFSNTGRYIEEQVKTRFYLKDISWSWFHHTCPRNQGRLLKNNAFFQTSIRAVIKTRVG